MQQATPPGPDPRPPAKVAHITQPYIVLIHDTQGHGYYMCAYPLHHQRFCVKLPHWPN